MLKNYVVRNIVGPAGQKVAGRHCMAGTMLQLDESTAARELARGVIESAEMPSAGDGEGAASAESQPAGSGDEASAPAANRARASRPTRKE